MSSSNHFRADSEGVEESIGPAESSTGADFHASADEPTRTWEHCEPEFDESIESRFDLGLLGPSENPQALGRIGKYDLLSRVGQGAMGVVFRGFDVQLHRTVAIKVLNRALASSPTARRRFIREARAAAGIHHDNVVTIHAVEEHPRCSFLVMEFVEGRTLRERIRDKDPIHPVEAIRLSGQIAAGLAAAHAQGVIHRDIKPGNIMLEDGLNRAKLTDFGLARLTIDNVDLTTEGVVLGTPSYMSPEQIRGERIDARADLFSLGCVMYAMLSGNSPFQGRHSFDVSRQIIDSRPLPPHDVDPKTPRFLSDMVMRLLEKAPDDRYQSAAEVAHVLNRHMAVINQTPSDQLSQVLRTEATSSAAIRPMKRLLAAAGGIVALLLIVLGIIIWFQPASTAPPEKLTVSQTGPADFATISEALKHAGAGTRIVVVDDGRYEEVIVLDQPQRMNGLVLEAAGMARLSAPVFQKSVIRIRNVSDIALRGFQLDVKDTQHGIEMTGPCPGAVIENIRIRQTPGSVLAAIYLHQGASGTAERPVILQELDVTCGNVGIVIGQDDTPPNAATVSSVRLKNSRVMGPGQDYGVLLILMSSLDRIEVTGNVFAHGLTGLSFAVPEANKADRVTIAENTFFDLGHFLAYLNSSDDQHLRIHSNVIARTDGLLLGEAGLAALPDGFAENLWENSESLNAAHAESVAKIVETIPFQSLDRTHKDYLKPVSGTRP